MGAANNPILNAKSSKNNIIFMPGDRKSSIITFGKILWCPLNTATNNALQMVKGRARHSMRRIVLKKGGLSKISSIPGDKIYNKNEKTIEDKRQVPKEIEKCLFNRFMLLVLNCATNLGNRLGNPKLAVTFINSNIERASRKVPKLYGSRYRARATLFSIDRIFPKPRLINTKMLSFTKFLNKLNLI